MSSNTGVSILDEALGCISQRIVSILIRPAEQDDAYITSLHNEVVRISYHSRVCKPQLNNDSAQLAAAWIIGLLASSGSSPHVPEPVRVAFRSFTDIKNPKTYAAPDKSLLLQAGTEISIDSTFNLTEWWKFTEGETLSEPFDVGEELVGALMRALEMVSPLF
jgi:hypothetical protein